MLSGCGSAKRPSLLRRPALGSNAEPLGLPPSPEGCRCDFAAFFSVFFLGGGEP